MVRFGKTRSRRGFTIAEVLVVVAILAILLVFAAPPVIGAFIRMHLNSLDDSAFTIFAAAQNSLTTMVGNGELETFATNTAGGGGFVSTQITSKPEDLDDTLWSVYSADMRYLDSAETTHQDALKKLLPGGSIESKLAEHRYVVEYNAKTGAVYAVWYSDETAFQDESACGYDTFAKKERGFDDRLHASPLIGYYGGSGIDYAGVGQMPAPKLTLTNAEELRLHIEMPAAAGSGFGTGDIGLEITVTGKQSGKSIRLSDRTAANRLLLDEGLFGDLLLDTLDTTKSTTLQADRKLNSIAYGKPFHEWTDVGDPTTKLTPGEDITVTVTAYYAGNDNTKAYLPQSASVTGNSLFASVQETGAAADTYTANIAYGRHLQNLDAATSGVNTAGAALTITAAEQVQAIDFAATVPAGATGTAADDPIYYWASTYQDGSAAKPFTAIYNSALSSYDGKSLPISNLNAEPNPTAVGSSGSIYAAGLFASIGSTSTVATLQNITLIDPAAGKGSSSTDANQVGALAGQAANTTISNCQAYLSDKNDGIPTTATPRIVSNGTNQSAGGLVGLVVGDNVEIKNSFASVVVTGTTWGTGGLVGGVRNGFDLKITNSYGAGYLSGYYVGGLVGCVGTTSGGTTALTITNSYAAGIIASVSGGTSGSCSAGGLVGSFPSSATYNVQIENCYAAVRYGASTGFAAGTQFYGAAPGVTAAGVTPSNRNVYYVSQAGVSYETGSGTAVNSKQLSEMEASPSTGVVAGDNYLDNSTGAWYQLPAEKSSATPNANPTYATFPYRQTDDTRELSTPYPYPQLLMRDAGGRPITNTDGENLPMLHYGDWLESEEAGALLVYFEQYKPKTGETLPGYGFYALELTADTNGRPVVTNEPLLNTLHADGDPDGDIVTVDGYLLVSPAELTRTEYKIDGTAHTDLTSEPDTNLTDALAAALAAQDGFEEYKNVYTFHTDDTPVKDLYCKLELNEQTFYYNPHFACEAYTVPADATVFSAPTNWLAKPGAGGQSTTGDYTGSVVLRSARQLAFMAVYTNGTGHGTSAITDAQHWTWHQLLNIDYSTYTAGAITAGATGTGSNPGDNVGTENNPQRPAVLSRGHYYGNNHRIKNLYLGSYMYGGTYAGLFGELAGATIVQDLTLDTVTVNCLAESDSTNAYTGALAGRAGAGGGNVSITNCTVVDGTVTLSRATSTGEAHIGALVGSFLGTGRVTNCGAYVTVGNYTNHKVNAIGGYTVYAGGLIGYIGSNGGTVSNSYAAVQVTNTATSDVSSAGGFAGRMDGGTVTNCYAGGHTDSGVYSNVENSINVQGNNAGGFVGYYYRDGTTFSGVCYSTCSVRTTSSTYSTDHVGMFVGCYYRSTGPASPTGDDRLYATGATFDKNFCAVTPRDESSYLTELIPAADRSTGDDWFTTDNYDTTLITTTSTYKDYPYPSNLTAHHGDWGARLALLYYEVYGTRPSTSQLIEESSGSSRYYGFYGTLYDADGTSTAVNTLLDAKDGVLPKDSGYAVVSAQDLGDKYDWRLVNGSSGTASTTSATDRIVKLTATSFADTSGTTYLYTLPKAALDAAPASTYYRTIIINGMGAAFNPWFACEAVNAPNGPATSKEVKIDSSTTYTYTETGYAPDAISAKTDFVTGSTTADKDVLIRTPRNLAAMARYTRGSSTALRNESRGWNYHQLLDLDFASGVYTGTVDDGTTTTPGKGTNDAPLAPAYLSSGSYDGSTGATTGTDPVSHTIKNLYVGATSTQDSTVDDLYAAGLFSYLGNAGADRTSVKNLTLQALHVQGGTTAAYTGGLAGYVEGGTVDNVTVDTATVELARTGTGGGSETCVGGLVGYATGAKLKDCTGINLKVDATAAVTGNARVGGLIGRLVGGSEATNCGLYAEEFTDTAPGSTTKTAADMYDETGVRFADITGTSAAVNNDYVGGFAGDINSSSVTGCFAAVKVTGKKYVGGFAGQLNGATATNCYAGGRVVEPSGSSGGNSYDYQEPSTDHNYANVTGTGHGAHVGGFAGQAAGEVTLSGICYTTCSVYSDQNSRSENEQYLGLFFGAMSKGGNGTVTVDNSAGTPMLYAGGSYFGATDAAAIRNEEDYDLLSGPGLHDAMPDTTTGTPSAPTKPTHTYPYGVPSGSATFPYVSNLTDHYGDWRQPVTYAGALYWEKEHSDTGPDTYNFAVTATDSLGKIYTVDLPDHGHDGAAVTDWGYGYFNVGTVESVKLKVTPPTPATSITPSLVEIPNPATAPTDTRYDDIKEAFKKAFGKQESDGTFVLWEGTDITDPSTTTKTDPLKITIEEDTSTGTPSINKTFALNRAFAAAIEDVSGTPTPDSTLGTKSNPYQIRTLGQLQNANGASGLYFKQAHDLNVTAHDTAVTAAGGTAYTHTPLTLTGDSGYDGDGYRIIDLAVDATTAPAPSTDAGLFGALNGTVELENIVLYAPDASKHITISADSSHASGGLVGKVESGTVNINNCAVAGYTVSSAGDVAGGLVGSVASGTLEVKNSQAVVDLNSQSPVLSTGNPGLGGLIGSVGSSATTTITNSYAGGRVVTGATTSLAGTAVTIAPAYAGGLIGGSTVNGTVTISPSYSYMTGVTYAIALTTSSSTWTDSAYLSNAELTAGGGTQCADATALQSWIANVQDTSGSLVYGAAAAHSTYVPENGPDPANFASGNGLTHSDTAYPFGAIVTDPHLEDQLDEYDQPLDAHVHYGTWPSSATPETLSQKVAKSIGIMAVYKDGTKIAWFPDGNSDKPSGDVPFRMWDKDGNEVTIISATTEVPNHADLRNVAIILKNYQFDDDSNSNRVFDLGTTTSIGEFSIAVSGSNVTTPETNLKKPDNGWNSSWGTFTMPSAFGKVAGYSSVEGASWHWLYDNKKDDRPTVPYDSVFTINFKETSSTSQKIAEITLSKTLNGGSQLIEKSATPSGSPGLPGPSLSSLPGGMGMDGPEIFDETAPAPTPTPEPGAEPSPTPEPSAEPSPTPEADPDAPQGTPEPSAAPEPTPTPEPTPETPPGTPDPTAAPEPTATPEPTPEPPPGTPEPTAAPEPTPTPEPPVNGAGAPEGATF